MTERLKRKLFGYRPADVVAALAQLEAEAAAETSRLMGESAAAQRGSVEVRRELKRLQAQLNQTVDQAQTDMLATLGVQGQDRRHLHAAAHRLDSQRGLLLDQMLRGEDIAAQIRQLQVRCAAEVRALVANYRAALALTPNDTAPGEPPGLHPEESSRPPEHHPQHPQIPTRHKSK